MRHTISNLRWSFRLLGRCFSSLLISLIVGNAFIPNIHALDAATGHPNRKTTFQGEKLTASFTSTSLHQVMEEISKVSDVQIRWLDTRGEEPITVEFIALPLSQVIPRLLKDRNFVLFYSSTRTGAQLTQVWISCRKKEATHLKDYSQAFSQELSLLTPSETDPTEGEFVSPDTLLQTVLYDRGVAVRLEAITRLEEYAPQDPRIAAAFSHVANNDTNPEIQHAATAALQRMDEE